MSHPTSKPGGIDGGVFPSRHSLSGEMPQLALAAWKPEPFPPPYGRWHHSPTTRRLPSSRSRTTAFRVRMPAANRTVRTSPVGVTKVVGRVAIDVRPTWARISDGIACIVSSTIVRHSRSELAVPFLLQGISVPIHVPSTRWTLVPCQPGAPRPHPATSAARRIDSHRRPESTRASWSAADPGASRWKPAMVPRILDAAPPHRPAHVAKLASQEC